ncbi:tape measure protein [Lactococcus lactis]|uniref:tape measure protein n=1 Tax=Lactococcus lactis TaxID=1358 RepID=UPI0009C34F7A|nr:tape measure protein [Lactococcus lactis]ARE01958.1 phage TMP protein [Lactococcus lactis subsp. lactis]ARE04313.1 prophage TMP [Lactococcus lactis subsp. lactis]QRZ28181.1 tape measure protein [Lactococcus lactis subsp. lactis]UUY25238.1 tape measure protein [Lactococcus lactis]UXV70391.2 tape measure protein [Lactococcus lactis subsp. lactis]
MAKEKVAGTLATNIGVNTTNAVTSIESLKNSVKDSTNAWKQMESQMKLSGDTLGASKAKYEGLSDSLSKQKSVLERLKQEQSEVNRSTSAGEKAYQKYASQITQAEVKLTALNGQQDKAKQAYEYQKSGLAKLNEEVQHSNKLTEERVKQLEAEGKTEEANKAKIDGLKSAQEKYSQILKIQKTELEKLGESGDKNSKAYRLQEVRVAQMSTKVSEATRDIKRLNGTEIKPRTEGIGKVKSQLRSLNGLLDRTHSHFKDVFLGNILATGVIGAIGDIKSKFTGALEAGVEYNKEMQNLSVSLNNFTNGNQKLNDSLVDNIKNLREESGYSIDTLSLLTKKTYGLTGSADGAKKLSDAFVNLGRATGKSDDAMQNIITKFTQMNASGEITSGSITKMEKTLPGFAKTLATTMGVSRDKLNELAKDGKISMSDLSKTIENMSAAKPKGLENYLTSFDGFSGHLKEKYQSLSGKITEGFFKTNNNFLKNMSKSLDGKETEKAFTHIGDSANKAVTTISKAFSSVFKGTKNPLADFANGLANKIEKLGNFISKHANDIKNFFGMVKNLGGTAFKLIGDTLKTVIPWLEKFGTWASKHPEDVKKIALAIIGLNVALKGTLGVLKGVEKFKEAKKLVLGFGSSIKKTATGMKLAFNFLKANPFILIITGIVAVVAAFVELYKHNKKFRNFINGIAKAVSKWAGSVVKWFKKTWNGVSKGFKNFGESFSKVFNSLLNGIKNAWNSAWSWIGNVFNKYIDVFKSVLKLFTDFFTGKWGNLGKDIHKIWDALWGFVESIFGKKVDSIKKGIEGFGTKIWDTFNTIKTKVSDFWKGMWDGLVQFGKDGINSVIGVINNGIGGINGVIHTFGGSKNAISKIPKLANGTKGAPKGVALINDAPGEHYQEAVIDNSGQMHVLEGRNRLVNFQGGETVVPAHAIPHFENGTPDWLSSIGSWVKDKWDGLTEMIKHPIKTLTHFMTNAISGISGSPLVTSIAPALGNGFVNAIVDPIKKLLGSLKKKHEDDGGGSQGSPSGSGVQPWAGQVKQALAANGLSTSQDMIDRVLRQISSESSGNEKAVQGNIGDINNITGDLAKGLMQTISATFNAYKFPGHGDIFNGYDNLLAALNYAKSRYGSSLSFLGNGHGYENGGLISSHGLYEIGEGNKPEMVIPLSVEKNARANQLLAEANQRINGNNRASSNTADLSPVLTLLSNIFNSIEDVKKNPLIAYALLDGRNMSQGLAPYMNQALTDYVNQQNRLWGKN